MTFKQWLLRRKYDYPAHPDLVSRLDELRNDLTFQMKCLKILDQRMMLMQSALDDLKTEVSRISGIKDSMDAAFAGLKKQLADALANQGDPAAVLAVVKDLHDGLDGLAASVVANP